MEEEPRKNFAQNRVVSQSRPRSLAPFSSSIASRQCWRRVASPSWKILNPRLSPEIGKILQGHYPPMPLIAAKA